MTPSVLLISLDTLRVDVATSGKYPTFERLARDGTSFTHAVASAPLTPVSHASVLTGLQPFNHGVRHLFREQLAPGVRTLQAVLQNVGYTTGAVVSCPGLHRWYGMDDGFSHYDDEIPLLADGRDPLEVVDVEIRGTALKRAPVVVERALSWLDQVKSEPFFGFVHFFDAHWPYEAPTDFGIPVANPYEGEVAYMDHHLGLLLEGVESMGVSLDELVVVAFSDHGEDLAGWYPNDHAGDLGYPEERGHGALLFDATQLVPLWIRAPGRFPAGATARAQVRLVDIAPTILDLLQIPAPPMDGESLLPYAEGHRGHRPAYFETYYREELALSKPEFSRLKALRGLRYEDRLKLIWEVGGDGTWIYELENDPLERRPLTLSDGLAAVTAKPEVQGR